MTELRKALDKFWHWASMTPIDYSVKKNEKEWETTYQHWDSIYECVKLEIDRVDNGEGNELDDILEAMAIDNESEIIMDLIEDRPNIVNAIIEKGYNYYQPETRWQIAELIKRVGSKSWVHFLADMIVKDKNKYVQRRALLSLNEISTKDAQIYALKMLGDEDALLNRVCLRILGK